MRRDLVVPFVVCWTVLWCGVGGETTQTDIEKLLSLLKEEDLFLNSHRAEEDDRSSCEAEGTEYCANNGDHWTCNDDSEDPKGYKCECETDYKLDDNGIKCIAKAGCEDLGGNSECKKKGDHWTCKDAPSETEKYKCECEENFKDIGGTCTEIAGCEEEGRNFCFSNGAHWVCKDDTNQPKGYRCECEEGFKEDFGTCIGKSGCKDSGGTNFCRNIGVQWICMDDILEPGNFRCECEEGYKNISGNCVEKTGCEDLGGSDYCAKPGPHWTCKNDKSQIEKYRCECEIGYKNEFGTCIEKSGCEDLGGTNFCKMKGPYWICKNDSSQTVKYKCECAVGYKDKSGTCIEKTGCEDFKGENICKKKGAHWICKDDKKKPEKYRCECEEGYKDNFGKCSEPCRHDKDCLNGGICLRIANDYFCNCKNGFKGDICEINEICENLNETCRTKGVACVYTVDSGKGYCHCNSNRIKSRTLNICDDKCELDTCIYGKCEVVDTFMQCRCDEGFEGQRCEKRVGIKTYYSGYIIVTTFLCTSVLFCSAGIIYLLVNVHRIKNKKLLGRNQLQTEFLSKSQTNSDSV